jgi:ABC-type uncharacterized transport system permease subunit
MDTNKIERGNRFLALRSHPAYNDLMSLSLSLVQQAHDHVDQYPGWDKDQIVMLAVRSKVAREFHEMLFAQINQAIQEGIQEGQTPERGETRTPGSF